ncbi:MAG: 1-acyl-sn-glycerol-3-phosphate acyltransferase [Bacteroidaceae bacterium]|nr:1-acyl-sn-glycerol-3-phosphate acyltransferase [Bacteroidaceae bacterium]
MMQALFHFIYFKLMGWREEVTEPFHDKCVICVAPHTSNWDLFVGKVYWCAKGRKASFMMKKEWFFFPLGLIFRAMGGIPVDRSKKTSLVDQMAERFRQSEKFNLTITPEGTRKPNPDWKKGFYYIALKAGVPIQLIAFDYERKLISYTRCFTPTGDFDRDIVEIKSYFKDFKGKHPENFAY